MGPPPLPPSFDQLKLGGQNGVNFSFDHDSGEFDFDHLDDRRAGYNNRPRSPPAAHAQPVPDSYGPGTYGYGELDGSAKQTRVGRGKDNIRDRAGAGAGASSGRPKYAPPSRPQYSPDDDNEHALPASFYAQHIHGQSGDGEESADVFYDDGA